MAKSAAQLRKEFARQNPGKKKAVGGTKTPNKNMFGTRGKSGGTAMTGAKGSGKVPVKKKLTNRERLLKQGKDAIAKEKASPTKRSGGAYKTKPKVKVKPARRDKSKNQGTGSGTYMSTTPRKKNK